MTATDPDAGDVLTFSLPVAPTGMTIDPASGLVRWTPLGSHTGSNNVAIHVRDRGGLVAAQGFSIDVATSAGNAAPAAQDDRYDARTGDSLGVAAPGVLANDSDPDGNRLRARALTQPANGNVALNSDGSFTYTPFTFQEGELVLAENVNLATNLAGTTVRASTFQSDRPPESAIDGSPGTSWLTLVADNANLGPRSRTGAAPFIEVSFPQAVDVKTMQALGHRDEFLARINLFVLGGTFQLFDESGAEIFNSGTVDMSAAPHDGRVTVPDLFQRSRNVARGAPGVVYRASSFLDGDEPADAFDGDLRTQWSSQSGAPTPQFLEVEFPSDQTVHRVRVFGNRSTTTADFLAFNLQVFDAAGIVLFDSGTVPVTAADSDTTVVIGGVNGARRVRVTGLSLENPGGLGGIAELEVMSTETVATRLNGTVRRARFTGTLDATLQVGLAEFAVIGSALMRRETLTEPNVALVLPTSVTASSFAGTFNQPENAIDDTVHAIGTRHRAGPVSSSTSNSRCR